MEDFIVKQYTALIILSWIQFSKAGYLNNEAYKSLLHHTPKQLNYAVIQIIENSDLEKGVAELNIADKYSKALMLQFESSKESILQTLRTNTVGEIGYAGEDLATLIIKTLITTIRQNDFDEELIVDHQKHTMQNLINGHQISSRTFVPSPYAPYGSKREGQNLVNFTKFRKIFQFCLTLVVYGFAKI